MNVSNIKSSIVSGIESTEVKSINKFFEVLFNDFTIYKKGDKPDLIFMKGEKTIMEQDLKNNFLWCRYEDFWNVLVEQYKCSYEEIQGIISYKVEETFKIDSLIPVLFHGAYWDR